MKPGIRCLVILVSAIISIGSIVLTGCVMTTTNQGHPPSLSPPALTSANMGSDLNNPLQKVVTVAPFDKVVFEGAIDATVNGHQLQNKLVINGTENSLRSVSAFTKDGVLYIKYSNYPFNFNAENPVRVRLDVTNDIYSITYIGDGTLSAENIGYNNLIINVGDNANVNLTGDLVMQQIRAANNSTVTAYWINSTNLQVITADNAKVLLGGIVKHLDIIASGNSEIDGKYLRTDDAYIKTSNNANVGVSIKHTMSTWSLDNSTVYYYRDTDFSTSYLSTSGSSLRMKGINNNYPNEL